MYLMIGWLHLRSQDPTRFSAAVLVGGRSQDHSCECICAYASIEYAWVYGLSPHAVRVTTKVATMVGNDSRTLCGTFHCYWAGGGTWQSFRIFLEHWLRRREPGWFSYSCPDKSWYLPIMIAEHDPSSQIDYTKSYPHHIYISVQDSSIIFKLPIWRLCRVINSIYLLYWLVYTDKWGHYFLPSSPFASQWEKSTGLSFENDACSFALNAMATASKCLIFRGNVLQPAIWAIRAGAWQFDPQCGPPCVALISPYQALFFLLRVALMVAGMIPILTLVRF